MSVETQASSAVHLAATVSLPPANVVVKEAEDKTAKVGKGTGKANIVETRKTLPDSNIVPQKTDHRSTTTEGKKQKDLQEKMVKKDTEDVKVVKGKTNAKKGKTLQNIDIFTEDKSVSSEDCDSPDVLSKEEKKSDSIIPLPSFKEVKSATLPAIMKSKRRSERICDNEQSQEGTKSPPAVDLDASMPIVRTDVSVKMSVSDDKMCNFMAAGGSESEERNKVTATAAVNTTNKNGKTSSNKELKKPAVQQSKKKIAVSKEDTQQRTTHSTSTASSDTGHSSSSSKTSLQTSAKGKGEGVVSSSRSRMDDIISASTLR